MYKHRKLQLKKHIDREGFSCRFYDRELKRDSKWKALMPVYELSRDELRDYHLENGFFMLTTFQWRNDAVSNHARHVELCNRLRECGLGYIQIVALYEEVIDQRHSAWEKASVMNCDPQYRTIKRRVESVIVPNIGNGKGFQRARDVVQKQITGCFKELSDKVIQIGEVIGKATILKISPVSARTFKGECRTSASPVTNHL